MKYSEVNFKTLLACCITKHVSSWCLFSYEGHFRKLIKVLSGTLLHTSLMYILIPCLCRLHGTGNGHTLSGGEDYQNCSVLYCLLGVFSSCLAIVWAVTVSAGFFCGRPCDMELVTRQYERPGHQQRLLQTFTEDVSIFSLLVYIAH